MSFNDLERGSSPPPSASTGLNGQSYGRSSQRGGRTGAARGPLPLYHSPTSSSASFAAAGDSQASSAAPAATTTDPAFKSLADRIGIQIFKLNSNVQGIDKLVELQTRALRSGKGPSSQPSQQQQRGADKDWTAQIQDLTDTTRALVKDLSATIKQLVSFQPHQLTSTDRLSVSKLQREFEASINAFARAQRESAKLSKSMLEGAKEERERTLRAAGTTSAGAASRTAVDETLVQVDDAEGAPASGEQLQQQQQAQKTAEPSQAEIEFQETLIAERESDIREIESGIHELNEIFRDLGHIVQEQGGMIDNIEYNVSSIAINTGAADRELVSASDYQRRAGRRAACLLLIVGFVVAIVLLAILS